MVISLDITGLPAHAWDASLTHPFWVFQWEGTFSFEVLFCAAVLFLSGVLCSAAGIGGGGVYVAVLMVAGGLTPHNAVPLSKAIVFFGSVSSLLVNLRRMWSPPAAVADKQVIDFDTCRVVVPGALFGTYMGVLLNWHARDRTIVCLLTAILVFMTCMVFHTAWKQYCEEADGSCEQAQESASQPDEAPQPNGSVGHSDEEAECAPLLSKGSQASYASPGAASLLESAGAEKKETEASSSSKLSQVDILAAGILLMVVVASGVLRFHMHACRDEKQHQGVVGSCRHPLVTGLFRGRMEFWMADAVLSSVLPQVAVTLPLWSCIVLAGYYGRMVHIHANWKIGRVMTYQATAAATGILAGLVGVGGGLVLSPFFLLTGMEPSVAVATSATCVLFTSSSTTIQYIFTDRIIMSLALIYGLVTLLASYAGTSLVHLLHDSFAGRRSYITFIVASGVALSAALSLAKFVRICANPDAFLF